MAFRSTLSKIISWYGVAMGIIFGGGVILLVIVGGIWTAIDPKAKDSAIMTSHIPDSWEPWIGRFIMFSIAFIVVGMVGPLIYDWMKGFGVKKRLRKFGKKTMATIVDIEDTGVTVNMSPLVRFRVKTKDDVIGTFNAYVSRVSLPRIGSNIQVVYNPEKPTEMMAASQL